MEGQLTLRETFVDENFRESGSPVWGKYGDMMDMIPITPLSI